ncbi:unnamed protein product [Linum trigynum]|uniref:Uncharacterized protein n=1 Tax=Linum trigynum TaxID=586398 RepID=A0AAV2GVS9_9ROSI
MQCRSINESCFGSHAEAENGPRPAYELSGDGLVGFFLSNDRRTVRWGNGSGGGLGERQRWSYEEWRRVGGTAAVVQVRDYGLNLGTRI